jgi:PAS domain S-box-containing protein
LELPFSGNRILGSTFVQATSGMSGETPEQKLARLERENAKLREQQDMYIQMLDAMQDMILVKDERSRITYANKAFRDFYGMNLAELQGIIDAPWNEPEWTEQYLVDDAYVIQTGKELHIPEEPVTRHDGHVAFFNTIKSPIFNARGETELLVAVCRDITKLKEVERRVNEFNSMVSHELRTPLTSIRAALGLIEGGQTEPVGEGTMELISIARDECDRLIRLINDLLDIKKIEANKIQLNMQELTPDDIVNAVMNTIRGVAREAAIKLVPGAIEQTPFEGDRDRIIQVLTNLVSNAVKFSPPDSEVEICAKKKNGSEIRFAVIDHGPGIPEPARDKLFTAFHQVDSSDSRAKGGTGLGLAICKGIVERHGGHIGFDSPDEGGSVFWFELPLKRVE